MRTFLAFILAAATAAAQTTVEFHSRDFGGAAQNKVLTITPTSQPIANSTNLFAGGPITATPTNGLATAALMPHSYRVSWAGLSSPITILVPDTNATMNAVSLIVTGTNVTSNTAVAYSAAASDARFAPIGSAGSGITNGQTGVTLAGTFSGNGAGLTNVGTSGALTNGETRNVAFLGGSNFVERIHANSLFLPSGVGLAWDLDANTEFYGTAEAGYFIVSGAAALVVGAESTSVLGDMVSEFGRFRGNGSGLTNLNPSGITNAPWLLAGSNTSTNAGTAPAFTVVSTNWQTSALHIVGTDSSSEDWDCAITIRPPSHASYGKADAYISWLQTNGSTRAWEIGPTAQDAFILYSASSNSHALHISHPHNTSGGKFLMNAMPGTTNGIWLNSESGSGSGGLTIYGGGAGITKKLHKLNNSGFTMYGPDGYPAAQLQTNSTLILAHDVNQSDSGTLRLSEGNDGIGSQFFQGAYLQYNGSLNAFYLGTHNTADLYASNDVPRLSMARATGYIGIGTNAAVTTLHVVGNVLVQGSATNTGTLTAANFVASAANTTTPSFKSAGTNNMILVAPDGGRWILCVSNNGALFTVTNSSGL